MVDRVRALQATEAIVLDTDDVPITEPTAPTAGDALTHWRLEDRALDVSYVGPS